MGVLSHHGTEADLLHRDACSQLPYQHTRELVGFVVVFQQPFFLEGLDELLGPNKGYEPKNSECECNDFHRRLPFFLFHRH